MVATKSKPSKRIRNKTAPTPGRDAAAQTGFLATRPNVRIEMVLVEKSALLFLVSLAKTVQTAREADHQMLTRDHALDSAVHLGQAALGYQEKAVALEKVQRIHNAVDAINEDTADEVLSRS